MTRKKKEAEICSALIQCSGELFLYVDGLTHRPVHIVGDTLAVLGIEAKKLSDCAFPPEGLIEAGAVVRFRSQFDLFLVNRRGFSDDFPVLLPGGALHWINIRAFVVTEQAGCLLAYGLRLSERTRNKNIELLMKDALKMGHIAIWKVNLQTGERFWSEQIFRILDIPAHRKFGVKHLIRNVSPAYRSSLVEAFKQLRKAGIRFELDVPLDKPEPEARWVRLVGEPVWEGGRVARIKGVLQDITSIKVVEKQIVDLSKIPEESPMPILKLSYEGRLLYTNGRSPGLEEYFRRHYVSHLEQVCMNELAQGGSFSREIQIGSQYFDVVFSSEAGSGFMTIFANDITELKNQRKEIEESRRQLDLFFGFSHDGFAFWMLAKPFDKKQVHNRQQLSRALRSLRLAKVNRAYASIFASQCAPLEGLHYLDFPGRTPEESMTHVRHIFEYGEMRFDESIRRFDGEPIWIEGYRKCFYNEAGLITGFFTIVRDVTGQKRDREKLSESVLLYRLISENSNDLICLHKPDGTFVFLSQSVRELLGYEPATLLGSSPFDLVHQEDLEFFVQNYSNHELRHDNSTVFQFRIRKSNGEYAWFETNRKAIYDADGNVVNYQTSSRNIDERKKVEAKLRLEKEKAIRASEAKVEFLSTMSHEIRTPLHAVIGTANLLLQENPKPNQLNYLKTLKFSAENLLNLINDILDFNKIDSGQIVLEKADFSLLDLVNGICQAFLFDAREKGLEIKLNIDPELPEFFVGDPMRLSQVITNLVSNAVKFTNEGLVNIRINRLKEQDGIVEVYVAVEDTGIGIPQDKINIIFERFIQAEANTTRRFGGTGLGLAITRQLLSLMGSRVEVKSQQGVGSTFYFTLALPVSRNKMASMISAPTPGLSGIDLKGARVLVVEDNDVNYLVINQFLSLWNTRIDYADNGKSAVAMVEKNDYDLVLMDLQMPVMNGYEATQKIRSLNGDKYQRLPIVALTASAISEVRQRILEAGVNDYIAKPFNPAELYAKIARFISHEPTTQPLVLQNIDAYSDLISFDSFTNLVNNSPEFVIRLVNTTKRSFTDFLADYSKCLTANDLEAMRRLHHKMKPSLKLLKFESLESEMQFVRNLMQSRQLDKSVAENSVKKVEHLVHRVIEDLEKRYIRQERKPID